MSDRTFKNDFVWAQQYIPIVCEIIGPKLLEPASYEHDIGEATDLIVLRAHDMRTGVRIRKPGYAERYPHDVTFRALRETGMKTELAKIIEGWGDWFFYGHAAEAPELKLARWWLCDLHIFRAALIRHRRIRDILLDQISNGDGTHFVAFNVRQMPPEFVIASSH